MVGCGSTFLLAFAFPDTMDTRCPSPQTGDYRGWMNLNVDKAVLIKSECADQSVSYMVGDWMRWLELDCVTLLRLKFHANSTKSGF